MLTSNSFAQNKYQVIKKAVSYELANFIFNYFLLKRDAVNYMYKNNLVAENGMLGTWKDQQVPNCLLYTSPSPRDRTRSRMPSSA